MYAPLANFRQDLQPSGLKSGASTIKGLQYPPAIGQGCNTLLILARVANTLLLLAKMYEIHYGAVAGG
jgi:hypothetical protein